MDGWHLLLGACLLGLLYISWCLIFDLHKEVDDLKRKSETGSTLINDLQKKMVDLKKEQEDQALVIQKGFANVTSQIEALSTPVATAADAANAAREQLEPAKVAMKGVEDEMVEMFRKKPHTAKDPGAVASGEKEVNMTSLEGNAGPTGSSSGIGTGSASESQGGTRLVPNSSGISTGVGPNTSGGGAGTEKVSSAENAFQRVLGK